MTGVERAGWWVLIAASSAMTNWTLAMLYAPVADAVAGPTVPFAIRALTLDAVFLLPFMALVTVLIRRLAGVGGRSRVAVISVVALAVAGGIALHLLDAAGGWLVHAVVWLGYQLPATPLFALATTAYGSGPGPVLILIAPVIALVLRLQRIHPVPPGPGAVTGLMLGAWVLLTPLAWGASAIAVSIFGVDPFQPLVPAGSLPHHSVVAPGAALPMQLLRCLVTEAIWMLPFTVLATWPVRQPDRRRDLMTLTGPGVPEIQWQRLPGRG